MLAQHPLGCLLLLGTLHWLRQLQVRDSACPAHNIHLAYMYGEPVSQLLDVKCLVSGHPVTVLHSAMLMMPACLCR